jgi:hypothetical protein
MHRENQGFFHCHVLFWREFGIGEKLPKFIKGGKWRKESGIAGI